MRSKKNKSTDKYRILKDFIIELVQESVDEDALKFVKSFLQEHKPGEQSSSCKMTKDLTLELVQETDDAKVLRFVRCFILDCQRKERMRAKGEREGSRGSN